MSVPEIMLIMILFHSYGYRCLKHFYLNEVCGNMKDMFPNVVSYNRFTELEKVSLLPCSHFSEFIELTLVYVVVKNELSARLHVWEAGAENS